MPKSNPLRAGFLMNAVTTDPAYGKVITGAHNHGVFLYDKTNGTVDNETEVHLGEGPVNSIRISPHPGSEGEAFVACYSGAIVRVSATGEIKGKFSVHENAVKALRIHPHKPVGVSCSADGILASWNIDGNFSGIIRATWPSSTMWISIRQGPISPVSAATSP